MDSSERPCPSPYPTSFNPFKDISNFKTPKRPPHSPQFFTASKQTPRSFSSHRPPSLSYSSSSRSKPKPSAAARRLKAFEVEQSQSSRKAQIRKEQSLKSLAKALTTWLNFLLQNPRSCGCHLAVNETQNVDQFSGLGKREVGPGGDLTFGVDATWRCPKRQKDVAWRGGIESMEEVLSSSKSYGMLRNSLKEVCSFDDLKQRMRVHLSLASCKEIFDVMTHVAKNIDEGRLKMKAHCPMVTDLGMKEKAMKILMCYNPIWLRIGLHILFGGDSLFPKGDVTSDQDFAFLQLVIDKQFFTHAGLAKVYAYNKLVDGLYRPGYYECLGSVILKRFLLLVLVLDRVKSQSSLPIKYGIDGVDGGSPPLFLLQSNVKSSREVINDFLSFDVMHGEGNLLAHLLIVGYKVSYQQCPLVDYNFKVMDLFVDLQDGIRLCRAIQLLQTDASILVKLLVPSNTHKKRMANCGIAFQYLKRAGIKLDDEDGMEITENDIVNGDKELTISLLWNIFVQLQLPLLVNKTTLAEEIVKIRGTNEGVSESASNSSSPLELLLYWIQAVCEKYDQDVNDFSSLVDGKAIWCLLDYYFRKELCCSHSLKDSYDSRGEESIMSYIDYTDAVHNFILSQKLTTLLGNFPEVLETSEILEHSGAISDRSVVILLIFLASQLTIKKTVDQLNFHKFLGCNCQSPERRHSSSERLFASSKTVQVQNEIDGTCSDDAARKFKVIKAWWQDMAERNNKSFTRTATSALQHNAPNKPCTNIEKENAAKIIQSYFRQSIERRKFLKMKDTVLFLQTLVRALLMVKQRMTHCKFSFDISQEFIQVRCNRPEKVRRCVKFIVERHSFVVLRRSVLLIQQAARTWLARRHRDKRIRDGLMNAATIIQKYSRGWAARARYKVTMMEKTEAACKIQLAWKNFITSRSLHNQHYAATRIQSYFRGWLLRRKFVNQKQAIKRIQCIYRYLRFQREKILLFNSRKTEAACKIQLAWKNFITSRTLRNQNYAATKIQSYFRGWLLRRKFVNQKQAIEKIQCIYRCIRCQRDFQQLKIATRSAIIIQSHARGWIERRKTTINRYLIVIIQRCCRGWLIRRNFVLQKEAAKVIQSAIRCLNCWKLFNCHKHAAIEIQRFVRGQITRNRLLVNDGNLQKSTSYCQSLESRIRQSSILKLQRWWRGVLLLRHTTTSAITIQSHVRGWIARQRVCRERQRIVVIQAYWKGFLARKESGSQLVDLRLRVQKSAKNVDDGMRIINRLKMALSELPKVRSVTEILRTCATLNMATENSQRCCEELVAAGAIDNLLRQIQSVTQSIPDQEVLKHALSTLWNLSRYQHLIEVLTKSHKSIEIMFWVMLRNKDEGYFIASEVLKKICSSQKGIEVVHRLPAFIKRLHVLVEELTKKATLEKKKPKSVALRENVERRLKVAVELLKLIVDR